MENMTVNIHFFRKTQTGRINYNELIQFFLDQPNFEVSYDDNETNIVYTDNEFGFQYEFKITRVSQVKEIYKLDPSFLNINFMLCLPLLIPAYAIREILNFSFDLCRKFELSIYHSSFKDVKPFNVADIYNLLSACQKKYLEENQPVGKVFYNSDKLSAICKYQRTQKNLIECFHGDITVEPCIPIIDKANNEFGICTEWSLGVPTVFAPFFDFVNIKSENEESFLIRRNDFMKHMDKFLTKVDNYLPDMFILKPKAAKKSRSVTSKLRKLAIVEQEFEALAICDLIDKV